MKNTYQIEKIDPLTYTDEDWNRYYDFRAKSFALINKPMPFDSVEQLKALNVKNIKESGEELYIVWKNGVENGLVFFSIRFKDDLSKRLTWLENFMNDRYLEANLLEMIFEKYMEYDEKSNSLLITSKGGMNDYIEDQFDAKIGSIANFYELDIKEANMEKIDAWLTDSPAKFPNLRIQFYKEIPDDLLEEYATVHTKLNEDIPALIAEGGMTKVTPKSVKDLQDAFKLRNYCIYSYLIFNEDNQLIALTNVSINLKQPKELDQFITGVKKEYRGRGLSKWLKAAMFKKLIADFPVLEKMETEAHPTNLPSIGLSKQMGYKEMGSEKEYLIDRAYIVKYLGISKE